MFPGVPDGPGRQEPHQPCRSAGATAAGSIVMAGATARSIQDYRWTVQTGPLIAVSAATGRPGQRSEPWPGQPPGPGRMRATIPAVTMPAMNTGTTFGVIFTPSTGV
jgi:hypothetical protein